MRKILVVDDDEGIRELLADLLRREGFQVLIARNAQAALGLLKEETVSLVVLLDWLMPQVGPAVLDWVGAVQRLDHHKVVVLSASRLEREWQRLLSQGKIAAYLPKPFDIDELLTLVQRLAA